MEIETDEVKRDVRNEVLLCSRVFAFVYMCEAFIPLAWHHKQNLLYLSQCFKHNINNTDLSTASVKTENTD